MQHLPEPDYAHLIQLFERTRRRDPVARAELEGWFKAQTAAMWAGREARHHVGMLAYYVAERQAHRSLAQGGKFDDLPNESRSVAALHYERFQPFCEEVDRGVDKTVDQFVKWVHDLTDHVMHDLVKVMHRHEHEPIPIEPLDDDDDAEPVPGGFVGLDEQIEGLQQAYQILPPRLFLLKVLKRSCGLKTTRIAKILDTTTYHVKMDLQRAQDLLDGLDDPE